MLSSLRVAGAAALSLLLTCMASSLVLASPLSSDRMSGDELKDLHSKPVIAHHPDGAVTLMHGGMKVKIGTDGAVDVAPYTISDVGEICSSWERGGVHKDACQQALKLQLNYGYLLGPDDQQKFFSQVHAISGLFDDMDPAQLQHFRETIAPILNQGFEDSAKSYQQAVDAYRKKYGKAPPR